MSIDNISSPLFGILKIEPIQNERGRFSIEQKINIPSLRRLIEAFKALFFAAIYILTLGQLKGRFLHSWRTLKGLHIYNAKIDPFFFENNEVHEGNLSNPMEVAKALKKHRPFVLEMVKVCGWSVKYVDEQLKKDQEIAGWAVRIDGSNIDFIDPSLITNAKIVMQAVIHNPEVLARVDKKFKQDKALVLVAVQKNGMVLGYADDVLKGDLEIVRAAVNQNWEALKEAAESVKDNKDFILEVVKKKGWAIKHASERLKKDPDVIVAAVKQYKEAFKYASDKLRGDKPFILKVLREQGSVLEYLDPVFKKDIQVVVVALKPDFSNLQYADETMKNHPRIRGMQKGMQSGAIVADAIKKLIF